MFQASLGEEQYSNLRGELRIIIIYGPQTLAIRLAFNSISSVESVDKVIVAYC